MSYTQDDYQAQLTKIRTAIESGAFSDARIYTVTARTVLAGLPDYNNGDRGIKNRNDLDKMLEEIDMLEAKSSGATANSRVRVRWRNR